jgi:hypothetical protein
MRVQIGKAGLAALLGGAVSICHAQEIAPFRNTGVEGYVGLRAVSDRLGTTTQGPGGSSRTFQSQSELREEIFVMTHNYLYHPNLATLDLGGGPILQQGSFSNELGDTRANDTLYNFVARASLLRDKPYQGTLYFEHLNPTISIAPGQVLTQQNQQYGMSFSLLEPATPVPLRLDASHGEFRGRSTDRFINDDIDRFSVRASRSFGALGTTQLQYQATDQASETGNPNLPVQHTNSHNQGLNLDSRFQLGAQRQYDLVNVVSFNTQEYTLEQGFLPDRRDARFLLDLHGRHSDRLQTYAVFNYSSSVQGDIFSTLRSGSAGLTFWATPNLSASGGGHVENTDASQANTRVRGVDGSLRYGRPLLGGQLQASYAGRLDRREQIAASTTGSIIGERIVLNGIAYTTLAHQHVVTSSIVVSNVTRTQVYTEGLDYMVTVVGVETRLQRVVGGAILDGQVLLVDYDYEVGGTFTYRQPDQTVSVNWSYLGVFNTYFRHFQSTPELESGQPTFPLNVIHSNLAGARADVPLRITWPVVVGGFAEHESRDETISPYTRSAGEGYVQSEEPLSGGTVRVGVRRTKLEYVNPAPGVDLHAYDLRYWWRRGWGLDLGADYTHETDTGGTVPRRRELFSLKGQWVYRRLTVTFDIGATREEQGGVERTRSGGRLLARRDF